MYCNLKAEMARHGIKVKDIAELLNVRRATVSEKINGKYRFYCDEALKIKKAFFPNYSVEYLFESNHDSDGKIA
jgi:plasmid maintenance system antidote protein VapI